MSEKAAESYKANISNVSGSNIVAGHGSSISVSRLSADGNVQLAELFASLRGEVADSALEPSVKDEAQRRVDELQTAVTDEEEPDIGRIESVVNWFKRKAPALAGAVVSLVVNPIVGQLVAAGGDALVSEFGRRFGGRTGA